MIKIILILLLALLGFVAFHQDVGSVASSFCKARVGPGTLSVQWLKAESVQERFADSNELSSIKKSEDGFLLKALTRADNFIEVDYTTRTYRMPMNIFGECQALDASVKIGYPRIEILYSDSLKDNQCLFEAVRAHELVHVDLYLNNEQEAETAVSEILSWIPRPAVYSQAALGQDELKMKMEDEVRPALEEIFKRITRRQEAFDSPAEYQRLSSVCK